MDLRCAGGGVFGEGVNDGWIAILKDIYGKIYMVI